MLSISSTGLSNVFLACIAIINLITLFVLYRIYKEKQS